MSKLSGRELSDPRRIWLTAADSAIGLALAGELLDAGHWLALTAPSQAPLLELASRYPSQVLLVAGDIDDAKQLGQMADLIEERWGALDTAICNARPYTLAQAAQAQGVPCANMLTICLIVQEALPLLRRGQRAHVVGVSCPQTHANLTQGTMAADLRQVFKALRMDLAGEFIDVSVIDPCLSIAQEYAASTAARHIAEQLSRATRALDISKPARLAANPGLLFTLPLRTWLALSRYLMRSLSSKKGR